MLAKSKRTEESLETILTFDNRDASQWSVVWSTTQIPGMDNATGGRPQRRVVGRRRLRLGSLALGTLLAMHCRVTASALTGGFFLFMMFLILAVIALANPLRHFEVYLGQWSISGPGRAFRIIPMLDGIGLAICINAIVRAITSGTVAAIAAMYVIHSVSDARLPFTYCRDFELKAYEPLWKELSATMLQKTRFSLETGVLEGSGEQRFSSIGTTVGLYDGAWRNLSYIRYNLQDETNVSKKKLRKIAVCEELYRGDYPPLYSTPAYNFFYVEVVHLRSDLSLGQFNMTLVACLILTWLMLWGFLVIERILHGRLIWNNIKSWFVVVPWIWVVLLVAVAASNFASLHKALRKAFKIGAKEIIAGLADALEVALYIHSASVGTEILHGKGLNHFASGHIDPHLHSENVWHSGLVLLLTALHSGGAAMCALVDYIQPSSQGLINMRESVLWIIPMYSKCTSTGNYSHLVTTLIFGGLMFSYMTVAFALLKTAIHTIFEYRVKLVFVEQIVVGGLILTCMMLSFLFATNGGVALLESVDAVMSGSAMPFVCLLELVGMLYVYRSHDFISDLNLATEENTCSTRISMQWQIIPIITLATLIIKIALLLDAEMPATFMYLAIAPLVGVAMAVPLRACHNAYVFLRPTPRRGT
ncbi:uncharacterized protein LOC115445141 isoform X2 [Manduca sexta]|uniref:uncharacterized protein LOC115445141 isoform X2 n=1 Tax=Manduca sexta TaxID=7130 RepID=UPI00188EA834|nr:uncharacterized protein LOC115445141 isoform X2 [Manduca sexta]